jgi:hypothetical protein
MKRVWKCEIGIADDTEIPPGADFPLRMAVREQFLRMFGRGVDYCASGWSDVEEPVEPPESNFNYDNREGL